MTDIDNERQLYNNMAVHTFYFPEPEQANDEQNQY